MTTLKKAAFILLMALSGMLVACSHEKPTTTGAIVVPVQFTCPGESQTQVPKAGLLSNSQFIYFSYATILNRQPGMGGFNGACNGLESGMSRVQLIESMINSPEFKNILASPAKKAK